MYFAEYMRFIYYRGGCYVERRSNKDTVGCAISGIFSKSGKRISGEAIIKSIATMRDRSNGLAEDLQVMESILNTKISMLSIYFMT